MSYSRILVVICQSIVKLYAYSKLQTFTKSGGGWIRTTEGINQQIYSLPHLATLVHPHCIFQKTPKTLSVQILESQMYKLLFIIQIFTEKNIQE